MAQSEPTAPDYSAALRQLIDERCGKLLTRGRHHESIERRGLRSSQMNTTLILVARLVNDRLRDGAQPPPRVYNVLNKPSEVAGGTGIFTVAAWAE